MHLPHFMGLQVENGVTVARVRHLRNFTFIWTPVGFEKKPNYQIALYDDAALHRHGIEMEDLRMIGFPDEHGLELAGWIDAPDVEKTKPATLPLQAGAPLH